MQCFCFTCNGILFSCCLSTWETEVFWSSKQTGCGHRRSMHKGINFLRETLWLTNFHTSLIHTSLGEGTCSHAVSKAVYLWTVLFFPLTSVEGFNRFWYLDFQFSFFFEGWLSVYLLMQAQDFLITHWYSINSTLPSYQSLHKMGMTLCHIWVAASKSPACQPSAFSLNYHIAHSYRVMHDKKRIRGLPRDMTNTLLSAELLALHLLHISSEGCSRC